MYQQEPDFGETTMTAFQHAWASFIEAIPNIIGFVLILVIGWFVASLIAKGVTALLHAIKFNELAKRSGFSDFVHKMGVDTDASGFLALIVKWFVRLIVLVVAFDALGLPAVSGVLEELLLWLPNLIVALVVLVLAGLAAKALSGLVRGATAKAGLGNPDMLARIASAAVWVFAVVIAVNMLGIATVVVNAVFIGLVVALSLALGLAFGLGGKDTASELLRDWRSKAQDAAPKLKEAAAEGARQSRQGGAETSINRQHDKIAEAWLQIRDQIKYRWDKLTDADLAVPHGDTAYLAGRVQERYSESADQARMEVQEFSRSLG